MKTNDIRKTYLEFFEKKGHKVVSSDSLVPGNDPTLLFTGAGMNQFKEYFLGLKKDMSRATSSQKCLRTGDLEEVGRTAYHHSFFEMLGNFSFGDYFKKEAIAWAWEFLTGVLRIPAARLRITVHESDDEAYRIWLDDIGIDPSRLYRMGDKSNFWPSNAPADGPNGPCGPCSEIYFDMGEDPDAEAADLESSRFAEIWNLVFTQYDRQEGGKLAPLKNRNIDTGMGLERLACVLQGKTNNFEIDLFIPIHERVKKELGLEAGSRPPGQHLYAISDHVRAVVFSMHDGVIPSNEGRGYVIRKLIRRALWHAHQIVPGRRLEKPFLHRVVPAVVDVMAEGYPGLSESRESIMTTLRGEEERFLNTLETGLRILTERLDALKQKGESTIPGRIVFELYDTYGFPEELTRAIAEEKAFRVDHEGFVSEMNAQRERAKGASRISENIFSSTELEESILRLPESRFIGYEKTEAEGRVLLADIKGGSGVIVLDQTPFYGESGGQVGDLGTFENDAFSATVTDTQKKDDRVLHAVHVTKGKIREGDTVTARVDAARRAMTMRNHTATHLLHAALRKTLGKQVRQLGSLVSPDKLRFDYSYSEPLSTGQIRSIEDEVNREILKNETVCKEEKAIEEARKEGAVAFFGEKYGEQVRIVTVGEYSKEFCGGTHCDATGEIGSFVILSDTSVASGTRRIEALTGEGAVRYFQEIRGELDSLSSLLRTAPSGLEQRIRKLQEKVKLLEKEKKQGKMGPGSRNAVPKRHETDAAPFLELLMPDEATSGELRDISDRLRSRHQDAVYFLACRNGEKIHYLLGMGAEAAKSGKINLKDMFQRLGGLLNGSGGGRPDLIQGGAPNQGQLEKQWKEIVNTAVDYLKEKVA